MEVKVEPVILTVLYAATILASVVGNLFLIYIVWKRPEVRSLTSFMFVNMAVADLLVTAIIMPLSIASFYTDSEWYFSGMFGEITCRGIVYVGNINLAASILCLIFMAIDRYYAVLHPLNRHSLWFRKAKLVTPVIWFMGLVLVSITLVVHDLIMIPSLGKAVCSFSFSVFGMDHYDRLRQFYFFYMFIIIYLIPVGVISVLYAKVAHRIWFHQAPGYHLTESEQRQEILKRRVVRMLLIIVATFTFCWLPAQIINLCRAIAGWDIAIPFTVTRVAYWIAHVNSAINPWLYLGLSSNIKLAFTRMLGIKARRELTSRGTRTTRLRDIKDTALKTRKTETLL